MNVTTAVIPAAGYGTRMLPVTAGVQKVMLPILDRPVIDYVVDECLAAGVTNVIFIINPGSTDLQHYYVGNPELEKHLQRFNKTAALERLQQIHTKAKFSFVEQHFETDGYGTNVTLKLAIPHLPKDEAFIFVNGDAFTWSPDGHSDTFDLVATFQRTKAAGAILVVERPEEELHRYGVAVVENRNNDEYLKDFVEQPPPGQAPSNLASAFIFVLTPEFVPYILATKPNATGEAQFPDALMTAVHDGHKVVIQRAKGQWLDGGNMRGLLEANLAVAAARSHR